MCDFYITFIPTIILLFFLTLINKWGKRSDSLNHPFVAYTSAYIISGFGWVARGYRVSAHWSLVMDLEREMPKRLFSSDTWTSRSFFLQAWGLRYINRVFQSGFFHFDSWISILHSHKMDSRREEDLSAYTQLNNLIDIHTKRAGEKKEH